MHMGDKELKHEVILHTYVYIYLRCIGVIEIYFNFYPKPFLNLSITLSLNIC